MQAVSKARNTKPITQQSYRRLTLELTQELCVDVEDAARKSGLSRSGYIRQAITSALDKQSD